MENSNQLKETTCNEPMEAIRAECRRRFLPFASARKPVTVSSIQLDNALRFKYYLNYIIQEIQQAENTEQMLKVCFKYEIFEYDDLLSIQSRLSLKEEVE